MQANAYDQEKVDWLVQNCPTCIEIFQGLCKIYAERPMFGFCMPGSDEWQTISYKQIYERVVHFAAGLQLTPLVARISTHGLQSCPTKLPQIVRVSGDIGGTVISS